MNRTIKQIVSLKIFLLITFSSHFSFSFSQIKDCKDQINLAENLYLIGDFEDSGKLLTQYQECIGFKDGDYYKLSTQLFIAQDKIQEAKQSMAQYINTKSGNYVSDDDPQVFKDLFYAVQDSLSGRLIKSLSKKAENLDMAAATVLVIKESEFANRGYNDIIDLLSDQPGFDISKIQSAFYANVFQRGFRQENTERTLFMIDGIEENDVWSNVAYISRQYPLSNISAVEIIYGPASTIYGARAFAGAINIITKTAGEHLKQNASQIKVNETQLGITAKTVGGSYNSKGMDLNMSGKNKDISFSLTGRLYSTNGRNLNETSFYNYDPNEIDNLIYDDSKLKSIHYSDNPLTTANELNDVVNRLALTPGSKNYNYFTGYGTGTLTLNADSTQALINKARQIDKKNYLQKINGSPIGYSNNAYNYYFGGKANLDHFEFGFRTWKNQEGFNYYQDLFEAGSKNGCVWAPKNTTIYSIYERQFKNISFSNTSSYVIHSLDKASNFVQYNSFYGLLTQNAYSNLTIFNIVFPDSLIDDKKHGWQNTYYYYLSRQFRNDFKLNYTHNRLSLISGIDLRSSQLQGDYQTYKIWATSEKVNQSKVSLAEDLGVVSNQGSGGNQFKTIDAGLYSQATFKAIDSLLYLTAGGRYDYNQIRTSGGFGGIFNPKLAVVLTVKKVILKTIYAQGIQNPSQFTKYSTFATRNSNPNLSPERIRNIEFVIQNRHGSIINWNISSFYSIIYDAISSAVDLNDPQKQKNQNIGTYKIFGSQSNISFSPKKTNFNFQLNFTYTNAKQTENKTSTTFAEKTMGDIAPIKSNLIINYHKLIGINNLNFNLRTNFVGVKPVGPNTTVPANQGLNNTEKIPGYAVFSFCTTYKNTHFKYLTSQFTINNILNTLYYSPGPRTANGNYTDSYNGFVPFVPQQTRNFLLSITLNL